MSAPTPAPDNDFSTNSRQKNPVFQIPISLDVDPDPDSKFQILIQGHSSPKLKIN